MPVIIQTQERTPQVLGPNRVVDAVTIGGSTVPSGVYFERVINYTLWKSGLDIATGIMGPIGDNLESLLTQQAVVAAEFIQDLDAAGLVRNLFELWIEYTPPDPIQTGPMTTTIRFPVERLGTAEGRAVVQGMINDAIDRLADVAAGG